MALDADRLLAEFDAAADGLSLPGWPARFEFEVLLAPHRPSALRSGYGAVYIFALSDDATCGAGGGRVLKVGRVGPNSNARFQSQHYAPGSSRSNLANSLIKYPVLWSWLGVDHMDATTVRGWMLSNLARINIFVPATSASLLPHLELYVRARVGSVYEGAA